MEDRKQKEQKIKKIREALRKAHAEAMIELCREKGIFDEELEEQLRTGKIFQGDDKTITVVGMNIKKQRLRQNITLQQLSDETLFPVMYLEDIENGNIDADMTDIHLIAHFIKSRVSDLYTGCD